MTTNGEYQKQLREQDKRQRELDRIVKAATDTVANSISDTLPKLYSHFFYGASGIDPSNLVTWYIFKSNADYAQAQAIGLIERIDALTRTELDKRSYPKEAVSKINVGFATDEDIQRETGGNYWHYFK